MQQYDFPVALTVTSLQPVHYLTKAEADSCSYNITTHDMWVKSWRGYQLTLQMLQGRSYGVVIENIVREIQQDNVGHMFEVDYLLWLTLTMRALLFQYSSSTPPYDKCRLARGYSATMDVVQVSVVLYQAI